MKFLCLLTLIIHEKTNESHFDLGQIKNDLRSNLTCSLKVGGARWEGSVEYQRIYNGFPAF